jgi:glycosyltransferase involved in cell wall biosynthesis
LKILIISTSDIYGGAGIAAHRLHQSLLLQGIESKMLVQNKMSDNYSIETTNISRIQKNIPKLRSAIDGLPVRFYKHRNKTPFSPSWLGFNDIADQINKINPDIVHLHWICGGMISIEHLSKIKSPIVWSCHDMWPFTGGCHYDENCNGYKTSCGKCPVLKSDVSNDLSNKILNKKLNSYSKIENLTVIGSSKWIEQCAKQSILFKDRKILNLPNGIDTQLFNVINKDIVKNIFKIPKNKKVILFAAMNLLEDPRKGSKELFIAINELDVRDTIFVIAGSSPPEKELKLKYPVYFIPPLRDEISLPLMYNIADVMIVPSLQENLANSIIESLACGVPVVCFDIGGNIDMVEHKKNGYLAKELDTTDMAIGIKWILENENYDKLSYNARKKVLDDFDSTVITKKYIDMYQEIIQNK